MFNRSSLDIENDADEMLIMHVSSTHMRAVQSGVNPSWISIGVHKVECMIDILLVSAFADI